MADSGGWKWQMEVLRKQFPNLPLNSGYRPGSITSTGNKSMHGTGNAVDVPPRMDVFEWIRTNYPDSDELIYSPAGSRQIKDGKPHVYTGITKVQHYDHIHWGYSKPGAAAGGGAPAAGGGLPNPLQPFIDTYAFFTAPGLWLRIGIAVAGAVLLLLGFAALAGRPAATIVPTQLKGVVPSGR